MKTLKNLAIAAGIILLLFTSCNVWYWLYAQSHYKKFLPAKLEISGSILEADSFCFFAVYKLSDQTLSSINQEGLTFFNNATKSRGSLLKENPNGRYDIYERWQQTPIKYTDRNQAFGAGLSCAKQTGFDESLLEKISLASQSEGSFYTGHRQGQLVVIPSLGIAVISGLD